MTIKTTGSVASRAPQISTPKPVEKPSLPQQKLDTKTQDKFSQGSPTTPKVIDAAQTKPRTGITRELNTRATAQAGAQAIGQIGAQAGAQAIGQATAQVGAQATAQAGAQAQTGNEVELGGGGTQSPLAQLTQANPELRTNQDLINHFYKEGGGNWAGAQQAAQGAGANLNDLVKDRGGSINAGAAQPAAPAAPNAPAQPNAPAAPAGPEAPAAPNAPAQPEAPAQPNAPAAPNAPAQPEAPAQPNTPAAPAGRIDPAASTAGMSESQRYDHYQALIEQSGGTFRSGPNERNIVSTRRETDADANGGRGVYDDRTVMLWTDRQGNKHVTEYQSNTEPSAQYRGRYGEDANRDGRIDQGRLPAGHYEYTTGTSSTLGNVLRPTQSVNAERDTNHDGLFNDNAHASAGKSMLFHAGGNNSTGSAGCQTMSPAEYNRFWRDLNNGGNPGRIGYTLINL